ncbi:MAG: methyltransferase domain-containing protein [Spirochaetia bacterium]
MAAVDAARSFLLVPAGGAGEGMGHLVRCLKLSAQLGPRVSFLTSHLDRAAKKLLAEGISRHPGRPKPGTIPALLPSKRWDLIVVDDRRTTGQELGEMMEHGLVACLDEGGEARDLASFTVDALPGPPGRSGANLSDPGFLFLPRRLRKAPRRAGTDARAVSTKVLLSFGGEDAQHLGERLAVSLLRTGLFRPGQLTVVEGPLAGAGEWPEGVHVMRGQPGLQRILAGHDLVITHFGMAAFEALAVGVPAILFNPSRYHARLGAAAGFPMIGIGRPRLAALKKLLEHPAQLQSSVERFNAAIGTERGKKLARVLRSLAGIGSPHCSVCRRTGNAVIARFPDRTYRRCAACGVIFMESFAGGRRKYDAAYFSSEYRAQYGRTYLEDFDSIKAASRPRVAAVRRLLGPQPDGVVLDVGCAFGPFLAAVAETGLPVFGLDVSPEAISYVRKTLRAPALCAGFEEVERKRLPRRIAALTLWYVLEHFPDAGGVFGRASALLPNGGVLAFSTPNGRGISARQDLRRFLFNSPGDHFTVFSPRNLRILLARYGLVLRRVRVTGHHPERFPGILGAAAARWAVAARALHTVSVLARLGDTFEAYAVKGKE